MAEDVAVLHSSGYSNTASDIIEHQTELQESLEL
jgi:hypothetical protein